MAYCKDYLRPVVFPDPPFGRHVRLGGREFFELARAYEAPGILIPAGTCSDGASIPRLLWRVIGHPFDSRWIGASINHDWRYSQGRLPREECDRLLRDEMRQTGSGKIRSQAFYSAVRAFGASHYNKSGVS